jgi:hypothetical protein
MSLLSSVLPLHEEDKKSPDPRLAIRIAVRKALYTENRDEIAVGDLKQMQTRWPSMFEAIIERERLHDPAAVGWLRMHLGMAINPWKQRADESVRIFQRLSKPEDMVRFAAGLLQGEQVCLPALVLAVCSNSEGLPLLIAMHMISPKGEPRRQLAREIVHYGVTEFPEPPFPLNREGAAFHTGFIADEKINVVFRESPNNFTVFSLNLNKSAIAGGDLMMRLRPVYGVENLNNDILSTSGQSPESLSLDDCRAHIGEALGALEARDASEAWRSLGHIMQERVFPVEQDCSGFVVGHPEARLFLDRFARAVIEEGELISELIVEGSLASMVMEIYGVEYIREVTGVTHGVSRLDVTMESVQPETARASIVGRTERSEVISVTNLTLCFGEDGWQVSQISARGIGASEMMYRPIWEIVSGERPLPVLNFGEVCAAEQELLVGLQDAGFRIDEVAAALRMGRDFEVIGSPGAVAAACHATYEQLVDTRPAGLSDRKYGGRIVELCDRYDADITESVRLANQIEQKLVSGHEFRQYMIA